MSEYRELNRSEFTGSFDEDTFRMLAEESPNMIFINKNGRMIYVNRKCEQIMGYTRNEICSPDFEYERLIAPESQELLKLFYEKRLTSLEFPPYHYSLVTKAGKQVEAIITAKMIKYRNEPAVLGIITDISHQKNIENALRDSEQLYRTTTDALVDFIHVVDRDLRVVLVNQSFRKLNTELGLREYIVGKMVAEAYPFLPDSVRKEYEEVIKTGKTLLTEETTRIGGKSIYTETRKVPVIKDGEVTHVVTVMRDITDRRNKERELRELNKELAESNRELKLLSLTDSHTGLYNHRFLQEIIEAEFARARRDGSPLSLIMLDIDYFKSINDVYGHGFGDLVLRQFAGQLKRVVRKYNSIIRYGGEEFIIVSPDTSRQNATRLAQRLLNRVNAHTFGNKKNRIKLKISIAISSFPEDGIVKPMGLVDTADQILGKAKEFGGNRAYSSLDVKDLKQGDLRKNGTKTGVRYLKEKIDRLSKRANQSLIEAVFAFAKTIELKDHYTGEHVERTVHYATRIAEKLGLSKDEIMLIKQAAILHDLGKVGISEKILLKPAKLNKKELKEIREHPLIGADIIRPIHLLHKIIPLIMYHHERWDGKGYPMGLKDREIPIGARIISLADTYQALISNRPYRKAYSKTEAKKIIEKGAGTHFDPSITELFLKLMSREKTSARPA